MSKLGKIVDWADSNSDKLMSLFMLILMPLVILMGICVLIMMIAGTCVILF